MGLNEGATSIDCFSCQFQGNKNGIHQIGVVSGGHSANAVHFYGGQVALNSGWGAYEDATNSSGSGPGESNVYDGVTFEGNGSNSNPTTSGNLFFQKCTGCSVTNSYFYYLSGQTIASEMVLGDATYQTLSDMITNNWFGSAATQANTINLANAYAAMIVNNTETGSPSNFLNNGASASNTYLGMNTAVSAGNYKTGSGTFIGYFGLDGKLGAYTGLFGVTHPTMGFWFNGTTAVTTTTTGGSILLQDDSGTTFMNSNASKTEFPAAVTVSGDLSARDIPGHEYFVSKYASIQAAIDAAYNNGAVLGGAMVIDDRTSSYSGPGFIVKDSVTLKLAATTYTITGTVSNNNGVSNVTAGIISMPGSHIVGAGTSANHGTNLNAGAGLNADLIATSTVGTGSGANAQWWHWGSIENFHMNGNMPQQTAGSCINVENMGETAVLRALEVGNCYADDIRLEGNFATQSEISNITVNSAGQFGVNLDNFQGVGVLRGLSGDSNATSIIRFNGSQSATLTVLGLKAEEEISGQDPLITIDMPTDGSQPSLYIVGGYTYGRAGVQDVIKVINGKIGAGPFVTVSNFYVDGNFVNAVNDTVNNRAYAASNMNKVPFSYLPTGSYQSGQAFTFAPGTFIQGGSSG